MGLALIDKNEAPTTVDASSSSFIANVLLIRGQKTKS